MKLNISLILPIDLNKEFVKISILFVIIFKKFNLRK